MHNKHLGYDNLDQIIYRGEGNSSIVIALKDHAKVIRLLKKDGKLMKTSKDHHVSQHPMRSINFIHRIMKPLSDPFLSGHTELIHLKSDLVNKLSEHVQVHRPLHRLDKTLVLDDQYALVMDDLCTLPVNLTQSLNVDDLTGPTISIEIKPKQGFLPISRNAMKPSANDQSNMNTRNCCIYGSTQLLKLARGRITKTSRYCPINLFSGCPIRMKGALEELIRNPQNNLRVFKDLVLAYGECHPSKLMSTLEDFFKHEDIYNCQTVQSAESRFIDLIIRCLLDQHVNRDVPTLNDENSFTSPGTCYQHPLKNKCKQCDTCSPSSERQSGILHLLPKSSVLHSVLQAQMLDSIGPHRAQSMLDWLLSCANRSTEVLEELSKPQMPEGFGSIHQLPQETRRQFYFRKVWEFLVSLTAKDCSIIITLKRISSNRYDSIISKGPGLGTHIIKEKQSGEHYLFNVGIADLDQKMPLKIKKICENLNLSDILINHPR